MPEQFDIAVIGGGPAGAAVGIRAARAGARVVIVEKGEHGRDKICGDGLTPLAVAALDELEIPLDGAAVTAIRLEALPHESLPDGGPGRAPLFSVGDFILTNVEAEVVPGDADGSPRPAAVVGVPVGFVGAAESKAALASSPLRLPFLVVNGRRGGSALASAAVNALASERE